MNKRQEQREQLRRDTNRLAAKENKWYADWRKQRERLKVFTDTIDAPGHVRNKIQDLLVHWVDANPKFKKADPKEMLSRVTYDDLQNMMYLGKVMVGRVRAVMQQYGFELEGYEERVACTPIDEITAERLRQAATDMEQNKLGARAVVCAVLRKIADEWIDPPNPDPRMIL